jgi:pyrrolidone-carboxylate peptidase
MIFFQRARTEIDHRLCQTFHDHAANPSWLITASLPSELASSGHKIHIHTSPGPIEVAYKNVRNVIPDLLFPPEMAKPKYDIVLHLGMATTRNFYALECQASRDGYDKEDVTGATWETDTFWKEEYGAPEVLETGFDTELILKRWKKGLPVMSYSADLVGCRRG